MAKIEKTRKALTSVDSSNLSSLSSNLSKIAEVLIKINERQQRKFKLEEKLLMTQLKVESQKLNEQNKSKKSNS
tara:strand:- start:153 stop:374 length:222 start_codon:yes stop_codon:yes gene_type:complete